MEGSPSLADLHVAVAADHVLAAIDRPKVERILENLLSNAAKYTPPDTPIRLRVDRTDSGVLLCVDDRGPGVADDIKAAIFEPFHRGDHADRAPGTGIGLTLVARFSELHGGRAWVEDRLGGGSSFRVFLPVDASEAEPRFEPATLAT